MEWTIRKKKKEYESMGVSQIDSTPLQIEFAW